ncbi:hypothetical protein MHYP_G00350600 [Metynnis hypsauchen]
MDGSPRVVGSTRDAVDDGESRNWMLEKIRRNCQTCESSNTYHTLSVLHYRQKQTMTPLKDAGEVTAGFLCAPVKRHFIRINVALQRRTGRPGVEVPEERVPSSWAVTLNKNGRASRARR